MTKGQESRRGQLLVVQQPCSLLLLEKFYLLNLPLLAYNSRNFVGLSSTVLEIAPWPSPIYSARARWWPEASIPTIVGPGQPGVWFVAITFFYSGRPGINNTLPSSVQETVLYIFYNKSFQSYIKVKWTRIIFFQIQHYRHLATLTSSMLFFHFLPCPPPSFLPSSFLSLLQYF